MLYDTAAHCSANQSPMMNNVLYMSAEAQAPLSNAWAAPPARARYVH
jgi:hypothetical protein